MMSNIREANFVLMICSAYYKRIIGKEEEGTGLGVKWEGSLILSEIYEVGGRNKKFIPILFEGCEKKFIPKPLSNNATYYKAHVEESYKALYRHLTNQPLVIKPKLGQIAFLKRQTEVDDTSFQERFVHLPIGTDSKKVEARLKDFFGEYLTNTIIVLRAEMVDVLNNVILDFDDIFIRVGCLPSPKDDCVASISRDNDFLAASLKPEAAFSFALKIQKRIKYHDWLAEGVQQPPFLRLLIETGQAHDFTEMFIKGEYPDKFFNFETICREHMREPVVISVAASIKEMLQENDSFYLCPIAQKSDSQANAIKVNYQLYQSEEESLYYSLKDTQFYLRQKILRRFAYLWLILDQLPAGSWGKSIPKWMKHVWKNCPDIFLNELMEEEGGFETTILNMDILCQIHGSHQFHDCFQESIKYLKNRQSHSGGFGPLGFSREGIAIQAQPRHTALALWFIGKDLLRAGITRNDFSGMFDKGVKSLFLGDGAQMQTRIINDKNPVLLYMICWHLLDMIKDIEFPSDLEDAKKKSIIDAWELWHKDPKFIQSVFKDTYETIPESETVESPIWPLTVPYGQFSRMELYSFLSALHLIHEDMPDKIKERFAEGLKFTIDKYFSNPTGSSLNSGVSSQSEDCIKRYYQDPLRIKVRGIMPYRAELKNDTASPDLGVTSMLFRFLRDREKLSIFWPHKIPEEIHKARYYLNEDLVEQFDSYLRNPDLYSLTNAGMLSSFLIGDAHDALFETLQPLFQYITDNKFSKELKDETIEKVISEEKIDKIILNEVIQGVADGTKDVQVADPSLSRLLVKNLRPGRYVKENLKQQGKIDVATKTLNVYNKPSFVKKFTSIWENKLDNKILIPFLAMLKKQTSVLDVGSGCGQYALEFIKHGHHVSVLDGSSELLNFTRKRIQEQGHSLSEFFQCNLLSQQNRDEVMNSKKNKFGAIWYSGTFAHIPQGAWSEILKFFNELLDNSGILFINIMTDNPRIFAYDQRFFTYVRKSDEFVSTLAGCRLMVEHTLSSYMTVNTHGEPLLKTNWINFYAKKAEMLNGKSKNSISDERQADLASVLTAHAYQRTVANFVKVHSKNASRSKHVKSVVDKLSDHLKGKENPTVLDAGCGPGDHIREMAKRQWKAYGIDISSNMIEYCKNNNLIDGMEVSVGDISKLPSDWSKKFEAIISITVFQHLYDIKALKVLKEFSRVLKKGGIVKIDVQVNRERGYDPDMRFIEGYTNVDEAIERLNLIRPHLNQTDSNQHFRVLEVSQWDLPIGCNTFKRAMTFNFAEFWLEKV